MVFPTLTQRVALWLTSGALLGLVVACGGGGGSGASNVSTASTGGSPETTALAQTCAAPRTGNDPFSGSPYPDRSGSLLDEQKWLAAWTRDTYLWYNEVVYRDPSGFTTPIDYFATLKTEQVLGEGADKVPKDRFHFTYPTAKWKALSTAGVDAGFGTTWALVNSQPPRRVVVAYTEPNSPATLLTPPLLRGTQVLRVDGVDVVNETSPEGIDALNAGLFPARSGESHQFVVQDPGATVSRTITLTSTDITSAPVQGVRTLAGGVGYLQFNEHIATAEPALIAAISQLQAARVSDLVLDIRYNGGGLLSIASELAYMVAGPDRTAGQPFERSQFNDKYPTVSPVTRQPNLPTPFYSTAQRTGATLPTLNLPRVFVLTGSGTCSASEAIINGLRGVGVQVIQIGSPTCGKPHGFYPAENCGTTYFSIQLKTVNALGFGEYDRGFFPQNAVRPSGVLPAAVLPGCAVADDFSQPLGDPAEARLAAALQYRSTGLCPAPEPVPVRAAALASGPQLATGVARSADDGLLMGRPALMNRIVDR